MATTANARMVFVALRTSNHLSVILIKDGEAQANQNPLLLLTRTNL